MATSLRADTYVRRVVDAELDELLTGAAAVSIEGAKGVGKTATAAERVDREYRLESPAARELLEADVQRIVSGERVLLDEWQHVPASWDVVRRAVDAGAFPGQFLLTGSATQADHGRHSGAGRILRVRMRPMTLSERGYPPTVSLSGLLSGERPSIDGNTGADLLAYADAIASSGFPGISGLPGRVRRSQLTTYIDRVVDQDIPELGTRVRNPSALKRWLTAYAAATATAATYAAIAKAATPGSAEPPSRTTLLAYRDALKRLYILDPIPGWQPTQSPLNELTSTPKHHLADPALVVSLLGLDVDGLLRGDADGSRDFRNGSLLGALFESLVTMCVRVYAQQSEARVAHFRTHRGEHEVDLIVERRDGRILALEVKLSPNVNDADVRHLRWLQDRIGPTMIDAAVITTGPSAYRRSDGIAVIPAALLGP